MLNLDNGRPQDDKLAKHLRGLNTMLEGYGLSLDEHQKLLLLKIAMEKTPSRSDIAIRRLNGLLRDNKGHPEKFKDERAIRKMFNNL